MPTVQSTYNTMAAAVAGQIANMEDVKNVVSRTVKTAVLPFGAPACRNGTAGQVRPAFAATKTAAAAAKAGGNAANTGAITMDATTPVLTGAKPGVYTIRCIAAAANSGTFRVEDPDGFVKGDVAVGATFSDDIKFSIADGSQDFIVGEGFDVTVAITEPDFVGIAVRDRATPIGASANQYAINDTAGVLTKGSIWVTVAEAVSVGDDAYFTATGTITKTRTDFPIPRGSFDTAAAQNALAILRIE